MTLQNLHNAIFDVCKDNFGIALSFDVLSHVLQEEIDQLALKELPTPFHELVASAKLDSQGVKITPDVLNQRFNVKANFEVTIHRLGSVADWLGKYDLSFDHAIARPLEDGRLDDQLGLTLEDRGSYSMKPQRPKDFSDRLIAQGVVDEHGNADTASYDRFETAAFLFYPDDYLDALLSLIRVPKIRESLRGIRLVSPLQFAFIDTHLIVHSPNVEFDDAVCTRVPFSRSEVVMERVTAADGSSRVRVEIREGAAPPGNTISRATDEPGFDDGQHLSAAFLYYYPKEVLIDWSLGRLKPALTLSDRGRRYGIYWQYSLTAALERLEVSFKSTSPRSGAIVVEAPVEVSGSASAGIKVGCVRHEFFGVRCDGVVNPLTIEVEAGITGDQALYIDGKISAAQPDIDWSTRYGFPFDEVADLILDRIVSREVRKIIGREVELYRRDISVLDEVLDDIHLYVSGLASNTRNGTSMLYSVDLNKG